MKIQDNRHLKYDDIIQIGDMVLLDNGKYYLFAFEENEEKYPVSQIDVSNFHVVNGFPSDMFNNFKIGYQLEEGTIVEIYKNKNLIIDIRS